MKTVSFSAMIDGTQADYQLLQGLEAEHVAGLPSAYSQSPGRPCPLARRLQNRPSSAFPANRKSRRGRWHGH